MATHDELAAAVAARYASGTRMFGLFPFLLKLYADSCYRGPNSSTA